MGNPTTLTTTPFTRSHPKRRSYLSLKLYQYELTFGLYMLEPWEKAIFNTVVILFVTFSLYTAYAYIPSGAQSLAAKAKYYLASESL